MRENLCKVCGKTFESPRIKDCCSIKCRNKYSYQLDKSKEPELTGIEGVDYLVCQYCQTKMKHISNSHLRVCKPGTTISDYKREFNITSTFCKDASKNFGHFMKTEKYRELYSDKIKGENNPNSKTKTTYEYRQSISPYSIEFYKRKYPELTLDEQQQMLNDMVKKSNVDNSKQTQLGYWMKKGNSIDESVLKLKERQATFTLEKCILKYGDVEGTQRWKDRQKKWLNNYKKNNFSKVSQELFWSIYELLENKTDIYFATLLNGEKDDSGKNNEYRLNLKNRVVCPDFINIKSKKIIEFDGVYWHDGDVAKKNRQIQRDKSILEENYEILHIREDEYYMDKNEVILKCLKYLQSC